MGYPPDRGHGWDLFFPAVGLHIREILCLPIWRIYGLSDVLSAVGGVSVPTAQRSSITDGIHPSARGGKKERGGVSEAGMEQLFPA